MKKIAVGFIMLACAKLFSLPAMSPKEVQFWKDFDSSKPSTLLDYVNAGFIAGNYWFKDNPLLIAINNKNYDTADALISANIRQKIDIDDTKDIDILIYLIDKDNIEGINYLLKKRGFIDDATLLSIIIKNKSIDLFKVAILYTKSINSRILIEKSGGKDEPSSYRITSLLLESIEKGRDDYVNELLRLKADVNTIGYSLLNGQLIYASIKPDIYTPLDLAIKKNNAKIIDILSGNGAQKVDNVLFSKKGEIEDIYNEVLKKLRYQTVTTQPVDLKELPRDKSFTVGKAKKEAKVMLLKQSDIVSSGESRTCWYFVKIDNLFGWVNSQYLELMSK